MSKVGPWRSDSPTDQVTKPKQSKSGLHTSPNASTFLCTNTLSGLLKRILRPSFTPLVQRSSLLLPSYSPEYCRSSVLPTRTSGQDLAKLFIYKLMDALFFDIDFESPKEPGYTRFGYGQGGTKCRDSSTHLGDTKEFIDPH